MPVPERRAVLPLPPVPVRVLLAACLLVLLLVRRVLSLAPPVVLLLALLRAPARFDRAQFADGADEMLVDGVVVIHRELHHADDTAEIGDEPAEHAGFVHAAERDFGCVA